MASARTVALTSAALQACVEADVFVHETVAPTAGTDGILAVSVIDAGLRGVASVKEATV